MLAVIVANGEMHIPLNIPSLLQSSRLVIAADGGVNNCATLGIKPDVIIGDMDSLLPGELSALRSQGVEVIQHPSRKDETDLELALLYALNRGFVDIYILGALGARWDMSLANILILANPAYKLLNIHLLDGSQELMLVRTGEKTTLPASIGDTVSLIPFAGDVYKITTHGLDYPLTAGDLKFGTARGVSNLAVHTPIEIKFQSGLLLCIVDHKLGLKN